MKKTPSKPIPLKIDFREKTSGIPGLLKQYHEFFQVEMCQLTTGDYLINEQIILERKRLADFLISIKTGRLFQQGYRMAHSGYHPLLILEGSKSEVKQSRISREAVQGTFIHLTVFLGIPVIRSSGVEETARLIHYTGAQLREKSLPRPGSPLNKSSTLLLNPVQQQALAMLVSIPGIGIQKGIALIRHFQSLNHIFNAEKNELQQVKGIGPALAENIYNLYHQSFLDNAFNK